MSIFFNNLTKQFNLYLFALHNKPHHSCLLGNFVDSDGPFTIITELNDKF